MNHILQTIQLAAKSLKKVARPFSGLPTFMNVQMAFSSFVTLFIGVPALISQDIFDLRVETVSPALAHIIKWVEGKPKYKLSKELGAFSVLYIEFGQNPCRGNGRNQDKEAAIASRIEQDFHGKFLQLGGLPAKQGDRIDDFESCIESIFSKETEIYTLLIVSEPKSMLLVFIRPEYPARYGFGFRKKNL